MWLNDLFWGIRAHFLGEIITFWWWMITLEGPQCIVDKSSKKILARGRVPQPIPKLSTKALAGGNLWNSYRFFRTLETLKTFLGRAYINMYGVIANYYLACLIVYIEVKTGGLWAPGILQHQLNHKRNGRWLLQTKKVDQSEPVASCSCSENLHHMAWHLPKAHTPRAVTVKWRIITEYMGWHHNAKYHNR